MLHNYLELEEDCLYLRKSRTDREAEARGKVKLWPDMKRSCWILPRKEDATSELFTERLFPERPSPPGLLCSSYSER